MWYQALEKQQFTLYTRLEAQLNKAYWLSTLHETASERKPHTSDLRRKLADAETEIEQLLAAVHHDMRYLNGVCSELIWLGFDYIVNYTCSALSTSNSRLLYSRIGLDIKERSTSVLVDEVTLEKAYVDGRAALIDQDDLEMLFDKAIAIVYDILEDNLSADAQIPISQADIERKLIKHFRSAENLLKHSLKSLHEHCGQCANHLEIQADQRRDFAVALTNDYKELFDTGMRMLKGATHLTAHRHGIKNTLTGTPAHQANFSFYHRQIERMHSRLITISLMRCETILGTLNTCTVK